MIVGLLILVMPVQTAIYCRTQLGRGKNKDLE